VQTVTPVLRTYLTEQHRPSASTQRGGYNIQQIAWK
jgi:hypothetical protein